MATLDLSRVESFQYPAAHLGHLSPGQQSALDKFKQLAAQRGYYKPARAQGGTPSHDDETLLRYLRARKFNPVDAFRQFKDTEDWRRANHLEQLYDTIDVEEYEETRRLYPQWTGRRDKRGIPVYLFEVANLNSKSMTAYETSTARRMSVSYDERKVSPKMLRLFALYENLTRFVLPLCSAIADRPHAETPISQSNNIVDISRVGLKQFWNLKAHMQDASTLATAHYPETLDRIFIIGAPAFFPTVWGWIKRWFDPITVSKIFILSDKNMKSTLEQYIDIENIPKKYGGKLNFEFGMMPILDSTIERTLQWEAPGMQGGHKTFPKGPIKWREDSQGNMKAVAVGSENGNRRDKTVATIQTNFKGMHGVSRTNTSQYLDTNNLEFNYPLLPVTTPGTATHPTDEGDLYFGSELRRDSDSNASSQQHLPMRSAPSTPSPEIIPKSEPNRVHPTTSHAQMRTGTSETRYEQQHDTHAGGQLAEGTPHDAVVDHGHGDKAVAMEPGTVGQAPKDPPLPPPDKGEPQDTSYLGQAKVATASAYESTTAAVGSASQTVLSAVGYGAKEEAPKEEQPHRPVKPEDPRVDQVDDRDLEEFLRNRYSNNKIA